MIVKGHPLLLAAIRGERSVPRRHPSQPLPQSSDIPGRVLVEAAGELECPILSAEEIQSLCQVASPTLTKHIDGNHLDRAKKGSFVIGTLSLFAPSDEMLNTGRFSDWREGSTREYLRSPQKNIYFENAKIGSSTLRDVSLEGSEHPVAIKYSINDFCWCATIGDFSLERARELRAKGNPELSAAVTYDASKLIRSVIEILNERPGLEEVCAISRPVIYGRKDRTFTIVIGNDILPAQDDLGMYLNTAFVKSPAYEHEAEQRVIFTNASSLGRLPVATARIFLDDPRIADAIVSINEF